MTPKQFIESRHGNDALSDAVTQERQLSYLTESQIQKDYVNPQYSSEWLNKDNETGDYFLNFVKSIFKQENFLTFWKYLRFPLPSSKIINNQVTPDLKRVFHADDSCFDYAVTNVDKSDYLEDLQPEQFNKMIFDAMIGKHNSIYLTDLSPLEINTPIRVIIPIENVVSLIHAGDTIRKIAFQAQLPILQSDGTTEFTRGFYYVDDERYAFLDENHTVLKDIPHDLGHCPAHFIASRRLAKKVILRESIFSYIREELEEFNFLKTLQKMTEPNGAIPITTTLKTKVKDDKKKDFKGNQQEPGNFEKMSSQNAKIQKSTPPTGKGFLQIGTNIDIPAPTKNDGGLDMDAVKYFINFHYIPVKSLEYLKGRIEEIRRSIITGLVGDVTESKEGAKNELQIRKAIIVLENTLLQLSADFSRIRHLADTDFLGIRYGIDRVEEVTTFYGSDFFLEGESQLLKDFALAPNPIERKTILNRLTETRYRNNPAKLERQFILNNLLPYIADADFTRAITKDMDPVLFEYQNRFVYWIQVFEAENEDIVIFFNNMGDVTNAEKFTVINNLIIQIINGNTSNKNLRGSETLV